MPIKNLKGKRFGRLVVIRLNHQAKNGAAMWFCQCDCGETSIAESTNLSRRKIRSCGCLQRELSRVRLLKHGGWWTPEYRSYMGMRYRCLNPTATNYRYYGARKLGICARWRHSFKNFQQDMGPRPPGCELDRIDTLKGYSPENCRWVDHRTNMQNNRRAAKYKARLHQSV